VAKALLEWLDAGGIESGPIFRPIDKGGTVRKTRLTDRSVADIVKAYAERPDSTLRRFQAIHCGTLLRAKGINVQDGGVGTPHWVPRAASISRTCSTWRLRTWKAAGTRRPMS
jgi:hypothetical protein